MTTPAARAAQPDEALTAGAAVAALLRRHTFRFVDEYDLQRGVGDVLLTMGEYVVREHHLGRGDRIDFLLPDLHVGVEVKIAGSLADLTRQLRRYAKFDAIESLLLVTARAQLAAVPDVGCPVHVVTLTGVM